MQNPSKSNCLLCGSPVLYLIEPQTFTCELCGEVFRSEARGECGHFICDSCHSSPANDLIEKVCLHSESTAPVELAVSLMKTPSVSMHGPEHHFLVPAVLLTAYYNQRNDKKEKQRKLKVARQRAENVLGGFCGFYGACGAGIGTGIFISLITDSTPLSRKSWGLSNEMTAESLRCIGALGGRRCCKRDTFMAVKTARKFMKQNFEITLEIPDTLTCDFTELNRECIEADCPFHPKERNHASPVSTSNS